MLRSVFEIRAAHNGYWFDRDAMEHWETEIESRVYPTRSGTFFVTSEADGSRRAWSVRFCDLDGRITTPYTYRGFASSAEAHAFAESEASGL